MKCCILFIYEINNATILFMEVNFYTALCSVVGSLGELNGDIAGIAIERVLFWVEVESCEWILESRKVVFIKNSFKFENFEETTISTFRFFLLQIPVSIKLSSI